MTQRRRKFKLVRRKLHVSRAGQIRGKVKRGMQKAKPLHKQHNMEQCDLCSFAALNKTGLAAHKRFKHNPGEPGKPMKKTGGADDGSNKGGSKVSYGVVGPKSSALLTWEGLNKLISEKEKEVQQLLDMKDALKRIVGLK